MSISCNKNVKFIVDRMHGDLARWLRILGYDTLYSPNLSDYRIIQIARRTKRIIITRDRGLVAWARRKRLKAYIIAGIEPEEKLSEIAKYTHICLNFEPDRTRCPLCNNKLVRISKDEVKGKVPPKVYEEHKEFWYCSRCDKIYWIGSHWKDIFSRLEKAKRLTSRRS